MSSASRKRKHNTISSAIRVSHPTVTIVITKTLFEKVIAALPSTRVTNPTPSFVAYVVKYALPILIPIYVVVWFIFFSGFVIPIPAS